MRLLVTVLGGLLVLAGCVWILQGINVLPGSFMTGNLKWAFNGIVLALVGVGLIVWSRRRPAP